MPEVEWDVAGAIDELRRSVADVPASGLDLLTAGVVSVRVPGDRMVVKPSGVSYDGLSADSIVVTDPAHAHVYRSMPEVGGVVNTRSTLSLAWAARREPIPHVPTLADEFAGPIPVGSVDTLLASRAPAVLIPGHGLFTIGPNAGEAIRLALLLEQTIRTIHIARQLGTAEPLDPQDTEWLSQRSGAPGLSS